MQGIRKGTLLRNNSRKFQAEEEDYEKTGFDRGHLNPNSYHDCGDSRRATFTLTNAVPQEPCFNQQTWKKLEDKTKKIMREFCAFAGAKPFFVTGTIPHRRRIPNMEYDHFEGQPRRHSDSYNRVSVPSHMWTAVCCDSTHAVKKEDREKGFSFGYIGKNKADGAAEVLSVSQLETTISSESTKDSIERMIQIFDGNDKCRENSKRSHDFLSQVQQVILIRAVNDLNELGMVKEKELPPRKRKTEGLTIDEIKAKVKKISNLGMQVFFDLSPRVKALKNNVQELNTFRSSLKSSSDSTVILTDVDIIEQPFNVFKHPHPELRSYGSFKKNQKSLFQNRLKLFPKLQQDKAVDVPGVKFDSYSLAAKQSKVNMTVQGDWCRPDHWCDYHGKSYVWCWYTKTNWHYCCISNCDSTDLRKNAPKCYAGGEITEECSMRSSVITVKGSRCRCNHECGLHGESYYWCYTDFDDNWEYCCQPWHRCNLYGESYKWCHYRSQPDSNRYQYCYY